MGECYNINRRHSTLFLTGKFQTCHKILNTIVVYNSFQFISPIFKTKIDKILHL